MDLLKPFRNLFSSVEKVRETDITRRNFLLGASAVTGLVVASRIFPFRTYSFAPSIKVLNVPGSLFKVGDRFSTPSGVIYEVTDIYDHSMDALRYSLGSYRLPSTVIDEYDFRTYAQQIGSREPIRVPQRLTWDEPSSIREAVLYRERLKSLTSEMSLSSKIQGKREFDLERNGSINKIITKFYQGEES